MSKHNAIVVTKSLRGGHYRGGQYHGPETTKFPPKTFTKQQMEHLAADPDLLLVAGVSKEESFAPMTELPAEDGQGSPVLADAKPQSESDAEAPQVSEGGDAPEEAKPVDAPAPEAKHKTAKAKD